MSVGLLTCPHCRSSFKMHKALPLGLDIPCPKCKERFTVSSELMHRAKAPAPAAAMAASGGNSPRGLATPLAAPVSPTGPDAPQAPQHGETAGAGSSGKSLALILGIIAVIALAVGAFFFWPTGGENPPTITGVSPTSGPVGGGTVVTIKGTGFSADSTVTFAGVPASNVTFANDQLTVTAPSQEDAGAAGIRVTTAGRTSAVASASQFTYITPSIEPGGPVIAPNFGGPNPGDGQNQKPSPVKKGAVEGTNIVLSPEEMDQIDKMKKSGIAYLKKTQLPDGTWDYPGFHDAMAAMGGLTLLSCGEGPESDAVKKAADHVRAVVLSQKNTYAVSLCILFLAKMDDALGKLNPPKKNKEDQALIRSMAARLIAAQFSDGSWNYAVPPLSAQQEKDLFGFLDDLGKSSWSEYHAAHPDKEIPPGLKGLSFLNVKEETPQFYKLGLGMRGDTNNSTTQLALLALVAAQKYKVQAHQPLYLSVKRFRATQNPNGTWSYSAMSERVKPGPAMTCCGLIAVAIGYSLDLPKPYKTINDDPAVKNALAAIAADMNNDNALQRKWTAYGGYAFWSIERIGVLYKKDKIGRHDWFRYGLKTFPRFEKKGGGWKLDSMPATDTCFVLLFLQQVNLLEFDAPGMVNPFGKPDLTGSLGPASPAGSEKK